MDRAKVYQVKLTNIKKDMMSLHEKTSQLKASFLLVTLLFMSLIKHLRSFLFFIPLCIYKERVVCYRLQLCVTGYSCVLQVAVVGYRLQLWVTDYGCVLQITDIAEMFAFFSQHVATWLFMQCY